MFGFEYITFPIKWILDFIFWTWTRFKRYKQLSRFIQLKEQYSLRYYRDSRNQMLVFPVSFRKRWMPIWRAAPTLPQILILDNTEGKISNLRWLKTEQPFELTPNLRDLTKRGYDECMKYVGRFPDLMKSDDPNARLVDICNRNSEVELTCQDVSYYTYIRTNLCLDYRITPTQTLRELVHPGGKLDSLSLTPLANNLGINCLLFTAGGQMVIQRRTRNVIVRPAELAPAFSGTVVLDDIVGERVHPRMIYREGREELGQRIFHGQIPQFLGITRELVRGGEPEMFFASSVQLDEQQIIESWKTARDRKEVERVEFIQIGSGRKDGLIQPDKEELDTVATNIARFSTKNRAIVSLPLKTAIALWYRWLEHRVQQGAGSSQSWQVAR
jgi:hypothetical protein